MGITAKNLGTLVPQSNKSIVPTSTDPNKLEKDELELLLALIKRSQFLGEHVEIVYNMTVKIQNQFLEETK
jgi:hypothetical protein